MANESDFWWVYKGFTSRWEKGDHKPTLADTNPTHNGVTQRLWDALARRYNWRPTSVFDLSDDEVTQVYRLIWAQAKCPGLPRLLAAAHFDFSVNTSGPRANACLQSAIGGVPVDGVVGPKTLAAAAAKPAAEVTKRYMGFREITYRELVDEVPRLAPNLKGWLRRCTDMREFLGLAP